MGFVADFFRREDTKTVLPQHLAGGPHGVGDPNDKTLRKVETNTLIPKKVRELARTEKCNIQNMEFAKCAKDAGLLMPFNCRKARDDLYQCMEQYYNNPEFVQKVTEEYLAERSEYRRTGIGEKDKKRAAQIQEERDKRKAAANPDQN